MQIATETTKQDWVAFRLAETFRESGTRRTLATRGLGPAVLGGILLLVVAFLTHGWLSLLGACVGLLGAAGYFYGYYVSFKRKLEHEADQAIAAGTFFVGKQDVEISQENVMVTRGTNVISRSWKQIVRVTANADYAFIFFAADNVVLVPRRSFPEDESFEMFVKSAVLYQWHGENALKADAEAAARPRKVEEGELQPLVIPMPSR